ncbi:MAG TPA: acyl-CoA thioesterase [Terriglobia bacterium]|nr:acyl-CoA thioesterase [Terriglobia bacterium]
MNILGSRWPLQKRKKKQNGKRTSESRVEMVEVVLPNDANPLGNILGGKVMHLIDIAGAIVATRHTRSVVVTVSVDNLDFLHPIRVGQLIILRAQVTRAFRTSVEVAVKVYLEDSLTGEHRQTSSAFVTYVALDAGGKPVKVPAVIPVTAEEKHEYREALIRRRHRLEAATRAHRRYFEKHK